MKIKRVSWIWLWSLVVLLACQLPIRPVNTAIPPSPSVVTPSATPEAISNRVDKAQHLRIFRFVWNTVERSYVYEDFNGVDWAAARDQYAPLIQEAESDDAFWQLMADLIDSLDDNHSVYLTPDEAIEEDIAIQGNLDYTGIGIFVALSETEDYGVVLFAFPGSPAEAAGLRAHDKILAVDGVDICCGEQSYENLDLILGEVDSRVTLLIQSPGEDVHEIMVTRQRIQTQLPVFANIYTPDPSTHIGYVMIPTLWDETIADRTREQLESLFAAAPLDGLIVDLRINGGGAYSQLEDILSIFTAGRMGDFRERGRTTLTLNIKAKPVAGSQTIPMVILIGADTESFAEVLSGTLKEAGRVILIGQPTAGNVETLFPYDLEDGSRLWLAQETFVPPSETRWEGVGVQPDITVERAWEEFSADNDPYINAALDYFMQSIP